MASSSSGSQRSSTSPPGIARQGTIFEAGADLGSKTITTLGSYVLLINNITGPGLAVLPLAYQESGFIVTTTLVVLLGIISAQCCCFLAEAMTKIPGNEFFQGRVEFTYLAKRFLPYKAYVVILTLFILSLVTQNISSIVESGQTLDKALLHTGNACALELYPKPGFKCLQHDDNPDDDSVFGDSYVISVGYMTIMLISIPLGYLNLDDNIWVQIISFIGLAVICSLWCIHFGMEGLDEPVPAFASSSAAFGYVFFNYSFVITVPSWINEKHPEVSVHSILWRTTVIGILFFLIIGIFGAMAHHYKDGVDLLAKLTEDGTDEWVRIATFFFPLFSLVTSIPVFSIIMRYNLIENRICSGPVANFWSVLFPWILSLLVYGGNSINLILGWAGIVTVGPLNFIVPVWLYLVTTNMTPSFETGEIDAKYAQLETVPEDPEELEQHSINAAGEADSRGASTRGGGGGGGGVGVGGGGGFYSNGSTRSYGTGAYAGVAAYEALPGWKRSSVFYLCLGTITITVALTLYSTVSEIAKDAGSPLV